MQQLSVMVRRNRAAHVQRAFEQSAIGAVDVWPTRGTGLGPAPQLQHRGTFHDDDRCVRLEAVVSDAQAEAVSALIAKACDPQEILLWSRQLDGEAGSSDRPG